MEPASIVGLILAAGKVAEICVATTVKLKRMRETYRGAPDIIGLIEGQCETIQMAVEHIKQWADPANSALDESSGQYLTRCLERCLLSVVALEKKVSSIASGPDGQVPRWEKIKLAFSKESLEQCLNEMRWQAVQADILVSAMRLPIQKRAPKLEQLSRRYTVHSSQVISDEKIPTFQFDSNAHAETNKDEPLITDGGTPCYELHGNHLHELDGTTSSRYTALYAHTPGTELDTLPSAYDMSSTPSPVESFDGASLKLRPPSKPLQQRNFCGKMPFLLGLFVAFSAWLVSTVTLPLENPDYALQPSLKPVPVQQAEPGGTAFATAVATTDVNGADSEVVSASSTTKIFSSISSSTKVSTVATDRSVSSKPYETSSISSKAASSPTTQSSVSKSTSVKPTSTKTASPKLSKTEQQKQAPHKKATCRDLLSAAAEGDSKLVKKLLDRGCSQTIRDSNFRTPLHLAAANGHVGTISYLTLNDSIAWYADGGTTPLHLAAKHGHAAAVTLLSQFGVDEGWRSSGSPHDYEAKVADVNASAKLRAATYVATGLTFPDDFYAKKTFTSRELAVIYGHRQAAIKMAGVRKVELFNAFTCACLMGDRFLVDKFLGLANSLGGWARAGLPAAPSDYPYSPLRAATMSGEVSVFAFLLNKEIRYPNHLWSEVVVWAARAGSVPMLQVLESRGVDLVNPSVDDVKWLTSRTPLSWAVEYGRLDAVKFLLKQDVSSNKPWWGEKSKQELYLGRGHPPLSGVSTYIVYECARYGFVCGEAVPFP